MSKSLLRAAVLALTLGTSALSAHAVTKATPVDAPAVLVQEQVTLQAVGQVEDDLAALVLEAVLSGQRTEWVLEQVLPRPAVGEVVATPVRPVAGVVPFDQAVERIILLRADVTVFGLQFPADKTLTAQTPRQSTLQAPWIPIN